MTKVAVVQMRSGSDLDANLERAGSLLGRAAEAGADLAVLPENFGFLGRSDRDRLRVAEPAGEGIMQAFLSERACQHGMWVVGGTVPLRTDDPERINSACLVYDPRGRCVARYDKIYLFDVELPDGAESYSESASTRPGQETVCVDTPIGRLGLAVCYDLRFPELFRSLIDKGATLVALPAAFTHETGSAHWEILVRNRAIENQVFLLAAAQQGRHESGRETWGHSMIVDPWGTVLCERQEEPGVVVTEVDISGQQELRKRFPVLEHRARYQESRR